MELLQGIENTQTRGDSSLCFVFVALGVAKVHEEPIAKVLSDVSIVASYDFCTGTLIFTYHFSVVFGVELRRKFGGIDQVAEHDRELPSFSLWRLRRLLCLGSRLWSWLSMVRGDCLGIADPDQNSVILINNKLFRLNQVNLQILDVVVIQLKPALQDTIGDTLLPLKQLDDLGDKLVIVHGRYSTALASAVSSR